MNYSLKLGRVTWELGPKKKKIAAGPSFSIFRGSGSEASRKRGGWGVWNLNFEPLINGTVTVWVASDSVFLLRIHFSRTRLAEQVWQTQQLLDQCFHWDDVDVHRQHRFVPAQTSGGPSVKENCWDFRTSRCGRDGHIFLLGIRSRVTKYSLAFVRRFFARFHGCTWNRRCRWTPIFMCMVVKRILLPCQD